MHTWHLAIVCFVYRLLVHRDEGCGAVYDLDSVVYKPFCVFTVQWMFMACRLELWTPLISGVQTHSQNRDTVQVLHGQNLGLCDFFQRWEMPHFRDVKRGKWARNDFTIQETTYMLSHLLPFVVWKLLPDQETSEAPQSLLDLAQKTGTLCCQTIPTSLMVMSLTREAFLRPAGSKPARTSPHLVSDCAGVWQLLWEGVLPSSQLE